MDDKSYKDFINQDFASFSNWLFSLNPYEFSLIASGAGFAISSFLTIDRQNSLGNFFILVGQVLLTMNAQSITLEHKQFSTHNIKPFLESSSIEEEIINIKKELIKMRDETFKDRKS